jgi:histidine triad (HIT) family protein
MNDKILKDENCIFCKIVAGEIPSYKIFENEKFFGFLTIMPHTKGHMLLIPKNHTTDILTSDDDTSDEMFRIGKTLAKKIKNIFNPDKVAFVLAGQGVPHLHLHLIPMNKETDLDPHQAYKASTDELSEIQNIYIKNI